MENSKENMYFYIRVWVIYHLLLYREECFSRKQTTHKVQTNCIQDRSGIFSISPLVKISMTSFPAFTLLFVQKGSYLYNKKITWQLEDMNNYFIFLW